MYTKMEDVKLESGIVYNINKIIAVDSAKINTL
jgi:hypothetical protein